MTPLLLLPLQSPELDRPVLADTSSWYATHAAAKTKKKSSGAKKSSGGKTSSKKKNDAYVEAGGGWQIHKTGNNNLSAWLVGGEAGWVYRLAGGSLQGRTRAAGMGIVQSEGDKSAGYDLRAGTFLGPTGKVAGLETGVDVFYSTWAWGNDSLPEAIGVEVPLQVSATFGQVGAFGGVAGAWTNKAGRQSGLPVHEGEAFAGLSGNIEGFDVSGRYSYRVTAVGPVQTIWLSVALEGATVWDLLDMGDDDSGSGGGKKDGGDDGGKKKSDGGGKKG